MYIDIKEENDEVSMPNEVVRPKAANDCVAVAQNCLHHTKNRMRRRDEPEPSIGEVRMDAEILVADPLAHADGKADVSLKLHSARVRDMSSYNAYLPANLPLSFIAGEASLVGDLHFEPKGAQGELLLVADGVRVALDEQEVSGTLRVDLLVRNGSAEEMRFDITGSSLALDDFRVIGKIGSARTPSWHARLQLERTEVLWQKPMHLDMAAGISIKDTRPFVALLDNVRGEHGWIDNLLTVEDLGGHLKLVLDGKSAVLSDSLLGSERISVGVKGRADAENREGMVYVRWHDLTGALELQGEEQHFHIGGARARFDAYAPGKTTLASRRRLRRVAEGGDREASRASRADRRCAAADRYRFRPRGSAARQGESFSGRGVEIINRRRPRGDRRDRRAAGKPARARRHPGRGRDRGRLLAQRRRASKVRGTNAGGAGDAKVDGDLGVIPLISNRSSEPGVRGE